MFKTKLEKLEPELEKNLPESVRLVRAFYFKKIKEDDEDEERNLAKIQE